MSYLGLVGIWPVSLAFLARLMDALPLNDPGLDAS